MALGHQVTIEPLLSISTDDADPIELDDAQAIIATSRNGLRALAKTPQLEAAKALTLFAVGPGTAAVARGLGFTRIVEGPASARELIPVISEHTDVNAGSLVHLAGDAVAEGFVDELHRLGYFVAQPIVYRTEVADAVRQPDGRQHAQQAHRRRHPAVAAHGAGLRRPRAAAQSGRGLPRYRPLLHLVGDG